MLSYRHAFHAGNHADVLKHFILFLVLDYFNRKPKPYWYIDTHSGAGLYHLGSNEAQKVGEYRQGIARLQQAQGLPENLTRFIHTVTSIVPAEHYCGSPWLAQHLLRDTDRLRLFELHPTDFALLTETIHQTNKKRNCFIKQTDGYQGLLTQLPPPTRRAAILIDPPYECKQDYRQVVDTLKNALTRFREGCYMVWYPCLSREDSKKLPENLQKLAPDNYLCAELHVHAPRADGFGMHGSGMFIINPPYVLAQQLQESLPVLSEQLAQDNHACFHLNFIIK